MEIIRFLEAAIALAVEIDIIYAGGSHPGSVRRILPISISKGLLKAKSGGEAKSFKLDLISLPDTFADIHFRSYHGIQDILLLEQKLILDSGLDLEADRFHLKLKGESGVSLSLHRMQNQWALNTHRCADFQAAAEALVAALHMYTALRK